jgi:spermidine synthase
MPSPFALEPGTVLAKFRYRHLPRTRISVVEINPGVIALRKELAIPDDDKRLEMERRV